MLKRLIPAFALLWSMACNAQQLKVLQFNIWQEGTMVPGGFDAVVDEIIRADADLVTLTEVRNYKGTRFHERITEALRKKGYIYYSFYSYDTGILSRFPLLSHAVIFPEHNDHGSLYKAVVQVRNARVAIYTAHLDYLNAANYLPRGYHSSTWKSLSAPVTDVDSVLQDNLASQRDEGIQAFLEDARKEVRAGNIVILGGDFNEPSHLDWSGATKDSFDHKGMIIPWHTTLALEKAGFKDSYRQLYPDPVTHPGFTFPADNPAATIKQLAWAPTADDRDRIDFIFFYPDPRLKLKAAVITGPSGSVVRGRRQQETSADAFITPAGVWPTDHKALLAVFEWNK